MDLSGNKGCKKVNLSCGRDFLVCFAFFTHVPGYAMDDEKGYIFLCFSSERDFIDDYSVCDHDQNSFSFRNEFISFNRTIHPLRQNRVQEHLLKLNHPKPDDDTPA